MTVDEWAKHNRLFQELQKHGYFPFMINQNAVSYALLQYSHFFQQAKSCLKSTKKALEHFMEFDQSER